MAKKTYTDWCNAVCQTAQKAGDYYVSVALWLRRYDVVLYAFHCYFEMLLIVDLDGSVRYKCLTCRLMKRIMPHLGSA